MENKYDFVGGMNFSLFYPHYRLKPFIHSYTFVEGNEPPVSTDMRIISNGYVEMFMHFELSGLTVNRHNQRYVLHTYVIGLNSGARIIEIVPRKKNGPVNGLILRFTHKGIRELMGIKISDVAQYFCSCEELWGLKGRQLFEFLADEPDNRKRKDMLDVFFLDRSVNNATLPIDLDLIHQICDQKNQKATVDNLAANLNISHRTLSRKFENEVGICPKDYMKIIRIDRICQLIKRRKAIDLPDILHYGGYFDQSHFIKEFKDMMNITPMQLLRQSNGNFYVTRGVQIT